MLEAFLAAGVRVAIARPGLVTPPLEVFDERHDPLLYLYHWWYSPRIFVGRGSLSPCLENVVGPTCPVALKMMIMVVIVVMAVEMSVSICMMIGYKQRRGLGDRLRVGSRAFVYSAWYFREIFGSRKDPWARGMVMLRRARWM